MKKLLPFTLLLASLAWTNVASAHAVVTDYSLKLNPIHAMKADKVEMTFNSKIELGLSEIFLVSKGDHKELLKAEAGEKQGQIIISIPALAPGDYAIQLKVFAADGHLTEDIFKFTVTP